MEWDKGTQIMWSGELTNELSSENLILIWEAFKENKIGWLEVVPHHPAVQDCSRWGPCLQNVQYHGMSWRHVRSTSLSFLGDKGWMTGNTDGMGLLYLASCSLNTQPKLVNMEMTGWRRMLVVLFCFILPGELAEYMLPLLMSEELYWVSLLKPTLFWILWL